MSCSRFHLPLYILLLLLPFVSGCADNGPQVSEAVMATAADQDATPVDTARTFHRATREVHCCVRVTGVRDTVLLHALWESGTPVSGRTVLDTSRIRVTGDGWIDFSLLLGAEGLPYGNYSVRVMHGEETLASVPFSVEAMFDGPLREILLTSSLTISGLPEHADSLYSRDDPIHLSFFAAERCTTVLELSGPDGVQHAVIQAEAPGWSSADLRSEFSLHSGRYLLRCSVGDTAVVTLPFEVSEQPAAKSGQRTGSSL